MQENTRTSFKAVLLGDSGVGKTSLVTQWITGTYQRNTNPTVGANHQRKRVTIDNREVDIFLWDTAGQEQFQALTPLYARSASVAVLTTSVIDTTSFDSIDRWLELLSTATEDKPPVVLVVNKIDLMDEAEISRESIEEKFTGKFDGIFFVSAATGEEVNNMFMFAAEAGYRFSADMNVAPKGQNLEETTAVEGKCNC